MSDQSYIRPDVFGANEYDSMKEPRYVEIATFMRAPLIADRHFGRVS